MEMKSLHNKRSSLVKNESPENGPDENGHKGESRPETLKPGSKIRPNVTEEDVRKLAERLYGIIVLEMCELDSYDDKNFLIQADRWVFAMGEGEGVVSSLHKASCLWYGRCC